jgi:Flp pilus assembly protein TadG
LVEFAIAVPIVLVLLLAAVQLASVYNNWVTLTDAARAGARVAAESRTDGNRVQDVKTAVTKSASSDLSQSKLTVDNPQTSWAPGSNVTVCAHYPYAVNILAIVVKSGKLDACTTQLVQ